MKGLSVCDAQAHPHINSGHLWDVGWWSASRPPPRYCPATTAGPFL